MDDNQTRRPETPDLPAADEDDTGTGPKRLVMSRELRGWLAVFAAMAVAAAAIAPTVDYSDLTGFAAPTVSSPVETGGGQACNDEDQSNGFNGQDVSCDFSCPSAAGTISIRVDADDSDADVSGTATCGGDSAHCSGGDTCKATEPRKASGDGSCSGSSDEFYDSGLYVECSSEVTSVRPPVGPTPGSEWCPVDGAPCIQSACYQLAATDLVDKCQAAWEKMQGVLSKYSASTAYQADQSGAAGLSCRGLVCVPIVPICRTDDDVLRCTI